MIIQRNVVVDARANEIVYAFQLPLPRDDRVLRMHRFFQTMTAILQLQVLFPPSLKSANHDYDDELAAEYNETAVSHPITLRAKLAHHSSTQHDDDWNVFASAQVKKEFKCIKVLGVFISVLVFLGYKLVRFP